MYLQAFHGYLKIANSHQLVYEQFTEQGIEKAKTRPVERAQKDYRLAKAAKPTQSRFMFL